MIRFFLFSLAIFSCTSLLAQDFSGQWKGDFLDKSTKYMGWGGDKCEYVLDLETKGNKVTGFSYTYFTEGGKRYYTICRLTGFVDKKKKYVEVREVERTKTNVPAEVNNCFQVHRLSFFKTTGGDETLEGDWIPAPDQQGNCGFGATTLSRRSLTKAYPGFKNPAAKTNVQASTLTKKLPNLADRNKKPSSAATAKTVPPKPKTTPAVVAIPKKDSFVKIKEYKEEPLVTMTPKTVLSPGLKYERRSTSVLKTIEIESSSVKIDLYDNGEIDGDSISLFLNGKLLLSRKKLTTAPITIRLPIEELEEENDLVMYAENLGSIPPNTALMVVTDGSKRYEVRITSDLQKNGTIRFLKRNDNLSGK